MARNVKAVKKSATDKWPPLEKTPHHVGIIMDGNGRWARSKKLPRAAGHKQGAENLRQILESSVDFGIKILTIYAFSTENWNRPKAEVRGLMSLFDYYFGRELNELHKNGVQLRHIGQMAGIKPGMQNKIRRAVEETRNNQRLILNVAFNYGGRAEIVNAVRAIIKDGVLPEQVTDDLISQYLYTGGSPDPDLIIRTSGEFRISNFLIWQSAYTEYYITPTYWPDFNRDELYKALTAYSERNRRYGQVDQD